MSRILREKGLLLTVVVCCLLIYAFKSEDKELIAWTQHRKVSWLDFKAPPPKEPKDAASTFYIIRPRYKTVQDSIEVSIVAYFSTYQSWVLDSSHTSLLNHEQRHFDLAEIQARKLRHYVSGWKGGGDFHKFLLEGHDSINKLCDKLQDKYDEETNHSKNEPSQGKWNNKIDSLLKVYDKYESTLVKIRK
jgi:hypothetical protein